MNCIVLPELVAPKLKHVRDWAHEYAKDHFDVPAILAEVDNLFDDSELCIAGGIPMKSLGTKLSEYLKKYNC